MNPMGFSWTRVEEGEQTTHQSKDYGNTALRSETTDGGI